MSNKEKQPKGKFFPCSILQIIFLMSLFIVMVQNKGFENLILIFCLVMFCLPIGLVKWGRDKLKSFDLSKVQQFAQRWYEANVNKQSDSTKNLVPSQTPVFDEAEANLFNIPNPPPDGVEPPYPTDTDEEIWGDYQYNEVNHDEQQ